MTISYAILCHFSVLFTYFYPTGHDVRKKSDDPSDSVSKIIMLLLAVLFLIFSIISMAFAVCIPKKNSISVFLFLAFILESE